jgi:ADP-ribose pyrophosphatase YjhB (NUDIX family)
MLQAMPRHLTFAKPLTTVDVVIFAVAAAGLEVLLVRRPQEPDEPFPGAWALPGGFIDTGKDADLEACALRKLREKTGVRAPYLEQLGSWGSAKRDPRGWSATHAYFALIAADDREFAENHPGTQAARWLPIERMRVKERLAFDHAEILKAAVSRLRKKVEYTSLPAFLMPAEFTLSELQRVHETVLGRALEKKAFRSRMLASDLLEEVPRKREGANRPAQLYRLKNRRTPVYFARAIAGADNS